MPKPFSVIVVGIGTPFQVPQKMDKEQFQIVAKEFEAQMMDNVKNVKNIVNNLRKEK
jgi:hypothetical protein